MITLTGIEWQYLNGKPHSSGEFKRQPDDFIVTEKLGYSPTGEGEHIYVWLQKQNLNTAYVAEQLAKFAQVPLRNVSYAGRKDKYALTKQWFGVHLPGNKSPDWQQLKLEGAQVLSTSRHNKKLRTGVLKGNQFEIRLRNVSLSDDFESRVQQVTEQGVPNYFAEQRFGVIKDADGNLQLGGNLAMAERMLNGETIRNRNKRSMAISALRSWVFNQVVSERIHAGLFAQPMIGDAIKLAGSNSFFIAEAIAGEVDPDVFQRLKQCDVELTAPMIGKGALASKADALDWETACLGPYHDAAKLLSDLDLRQERRALNVTPNNLTWQLDANDLRLSFDLPSGCYATAVLRELIQCV